MYFSDKTKIAQIVTGKAVTMSKKEHSVIKNTEINVNSRVFACFPEHPDWSYSFPRYSRISIALVSGFTFGMVFSIMPFSSMI